MKKMYVQKTSDDFIIPPPTASLKTNTLARAYMTCTLREKRILEALIDAFNISLDHENPAHNPVTLHAREYAKIYGVSEKNAYTELNTISEGLIGRVAHKLLENGKRRKMSLIPTIDYNDGAGSITAYFHQDLFEELKSIKSKYTMYSLSDVAKFKSIYTWMLYELLISYANGYFKKKGYVKGEMIMNVTELRKQLNVPDSYNAGSFKQRVLKVVQKELKEKSGITVMFHVKRTSPRDRRIVEIYRIAFSSKDIPSEIRDDYKREFEARGSNVTNITHKTKQRVVKTKEDRKAKKIEDAKKRRQRAAYKGNTLKGNRHEKMFDKVEAANVAAVKANDEAAVKAHAEADYLDVHDFDTIPF